MVTFIAPVYNYHPVLVEALRQQDYDRWKLLVIHDGPDALGLEQQISSVADPRITFMATQTRHDDWGHSLRRFGLDAIRHDGGSDFVVMTNGDNYYAPGFNRLMLQAFSDSVDAVYCDMVHNYWEWRPVPVRLEEARIDCGCVVVRKHLALDVGWRSQEHSADWVYIEDLLAIAPIQRWRHVERSLFVHN